MYLRFFKTILPVIFWQFTGLLYKIDLPQVKKDLRPSIINFAHKLPQKLLDYLRPSILANQEIRGKSQNWIAVNVET